MKYLLYNFFFIIIIFIFSYINSLHNEEGFTPKIKEIYRPHIRNARIFGQDIYNKSSSNISNLFRKVRII